MKHQPTADEMATSQKKRKKKKTQANGKVTQIFFDHRLPKQLVKHVTSVYKIHFACKQVDEHEGTKDINSTK